MAVEITPLFKDLSISEKSWTIISGAEGSAHENGNCDSVATSTGTSPTNSFFGSSTSSFSSYSAPEMSLPKSIVKKRRVGSSSHESYGQVTFEDDGSEAAITDEEIGDLPKPKDDEDPFTDFGEFDGDDESSEEESDEEGDDEFDEDSDDEEGEEEESDGELIADSYDEYDNDPCASVSFISFTETVSFNMTVSYSEPPVFEDSDEECDAPEETMTFHEQMARALANSSANCANDDTLGNPDEHGNDVLDVDKRLLVAYINGMRTASDSYKKDLASLALNINQGLAATPFLPSDFSDGCYLNRTLEHVIGIFPHLVADDELEVLLGDALYRDDTFKNPFGNDDYPFEPTNGKTSLHQNVSQLLSERLIDETMAVEKDVLDFFAYGIIYSLKEWASEEL
ncbi:hypothetical protein FQN54_000470 [Arachnomyces sp. PD_36]|nr:hypothetical protein FQN54_000470 [Arachnomyces sp. PD_36]